jgi:hypothetical protein
MRGLFCLFILLPTTLVWSCPPPTPDELRDFFEGSQNWTEVQHATSHQIAERRPVFLNIAFDQPNSTKVTWGDNVIGGSSLSLCWAQPDKEAIMIRKGFFRTILVKVEPGLMRSRIPIDGNLFYRKDSEVQRPGQKRVPAAQAQNTYQ